ncbi:7523_t:CDS:2 [Ambispora leptoticha]|uniref:7523_t:CDS:1 n=1 Tax=Ambispora leptoticha TaxID=144679 RepID=A0A9N9F2C9_9GLOM|nr:7523_t:CDS:2 [Ambispora leptoticha]
MVFCLVLGEVPAKRKLFVVDITENILTVSHLQSAIKKAKENTFGYIDEMILYYENLKGIELFPADGIPGDFSEQPLSVKIIHIIVQPPITTDNIDTTTFMLGPLSEYMSVKGNEIILSNRVMLNAQDELILNNGESVVEESEKITMNFVKFLRLRKSPDGIVYRISTQDIHVLIKSYLQMIEKIEYGVHHDKRGCIIIGSPGIGKTHFSLYLAFYIIRRYSPADIIYEQLFKSYDYALRIKPNASAMRISNLQLEHPHDSFYIADSDRYIRSPVRIKD